VFTRRPGRVKTVVDINLSRPRDLRIKRDPQFLTYEDEIWESIQEELAVPAERLIAGVPAAEPSLRSGLEAAYRELATYAKAREDKVTLVDLANSVRGWTMQ
jgi:hypothetical protein